MTLEEFGACVEFNIKNHIQHAILGLGAPGIGKSQIIKQIGKRCGYKVIDLRLAQMSEVEIGGLIYPSEDRTKTVWLAPDILPDEERDGEHTILLLDEITSCTKRVQVAAYQLILDRRIGQYHLPEKTVVVALGNREEDDGVYVQLAAPLADRFEIHYIDVNYEIWKKNYAIPYGVHPLVMKYLDTKPGSLHTQSRVEGELLFATPRSWTRVSDILKYDADVENAVIANKIIGNIGIAEGGQFIAFCKSNRDVVTADDFLAGLPAPTRPESVVALINALMEKVKYIRNVRTATMLSAEQRQLLESVIESLFRLPGGEFTVLGLRNLMELNRGLVKMVFAEMDNPCILNFVRKYSMGTEKHTA